MMNDQLIECSCFCKIYVTIHSFKEMNWLILFSFLSIFLHGFCLQCRTTDDRMSLHIPFVEFDIDDLYDQIHDLKFDECIYNEDSDCLCRIGLVVDHESNSIIVVLSEDLAESRLKDKDIGITTIVDGVNKTEMSATHHIEHACSFKGCEEKFVNAIQHIFNWFIDNDLMNFTNVLREYTFDDDAEPAG